MAENTNVTHNQNSANDARANIAVGRVIALATPPIVAADFVRVRCGFKPKYVSWENETLIANLQHTEGGQPNTALKTIAAGTRTNEVKGITLNDDGFEVSQDPALEAIAISTRISWLALG